METIRFCKIEEIEKLQQFLNDYWVKDHILSKHKELLEFQHLNKIENQINYVVAVTAAGEFTAVLGFIPTFQFSSPPKESAASGGEGNSLNPKSYPLNPDIWLAIWCRAPHATKGVGMQLYDFLVQHYQPRSIAAIGINDKIKQTYKNIGFTTGKLSQYYYQKAKNKISKIPFPDNYTYKLSRGDIKCLGDFENPIESLSIPTKNKEYFINRYTNHPVYEYDFLGIYQNGKLVDIIVMRVNYVIITEFASCCLRIVDAYNNFRDVPNITYALDDFMDMMECEYVDCLNFGIPESKFTEMGFTKRVANEIIIPNYFEPFVQKNIDIEFAYKIFNPIPESERKNYNPNLPYNGPTYNYVIFKGDSDQDRPNLITKIKHT